MNYETVNRQLLQKALQLSKENLAEAARKLDLPVYKLRYRIKQFMVQRAR
jgi:transcriptional regulator with GAF, ATPase, and Fis domain